MRASPIGDKEALLCSSTATQRRMWSRGYLNWLNRLILHCANWINSSTTISFGVCEKIWVGAINTACQTVNTSGQTNIHDLSGTLYLNMTMTSEAAWTMKVQVYE
jgi:hypothetical protein